MKSRMWALPPFYPCINLTLLSFLKPPVLAAVTFFLWAVFFVCFLGARSWTQELTHARCALWDGAPLPHPAHFCFLAALLQTSSYRWSSASCPLPGRLLPLSSFSLVLPVSRVAGYMSCLESLPAGLPSTVSSVILSYFLHIIYCCWKKSSGHLLILFLLVVSFLLL